MQIQINNTSSRAVYQQIIDQIKRDIALGKTKKGEKLPTVRELAAKLVINPNTIAKAYKQLEQDGIIVTRAGAGAFVAEINSNLSKAVRKKLLCQELERVAVDAVHMQIEKNKLVEWFGDILEKFRFEQEKGQGNE